MNHKKRSLIVIANFVFACCIFVFPYNSFMEEYDIRGIISIIAGCLGIVILNLRIIMINKNNKDFSLKPYLFVVLIGPILCIASIMFLLSLQDGLQRAGEL